MGIVDRWRPETAAGGYAHDDEAIAFYTRVRLLAEPHHVVLDIGAGRGSRFDEPNSAHARMGNLQGHVGCLIGVDVDPAVLDHPALDEAHVTDAMGALPLGDASVDMVVCEYVLEHVEHPERFAREIGRVLRPGGWVCALTPNRSGYVGLGNRILPQRVKRAVLAKLWPERPPEDAFQTFYRLNTIRDLRRAMSDSEWSHHSYLSASTPKYHGNSAVAFAGVALWQRIVPAVLQTNIMVFVRKRPDAAGLLRPVIARDDAQVERTAA